MNNRNLLALPFRLLLVLSLLCQTTKAQPQKLLNRSAEDTRIARLIGVAKVWGTVKYFHPYLAYRAIDWDKALIDAIPKVNVAKTLQDYQSAINQMLSALGDRSTHVDLEIENKTAQTSAPINTATRPLRMENRVLVIDAAQIARGDDGALTKLLSEVRQALANAAGVIIDGRIGENEEGSDRIDTFLRQVVPAMLDVPIVLGVHATECTTATRHRLEGDPICIPQPS